MSLYEVSQKINHQLSAQQQAPARGTQPYPAPSRLAQIVEILLQAAAKAKQGEAVAHE
jgi:hypothetical protein